MEKTASLFYFPDQQRNASIYARIDTWMDYIDFNSDIQNHMGSGQFKIIKASVNADIYRGFSTVDCIQKQTENEPDE